MRQIPSLSLSSVVFWLLIEAGGGAPSIIIICTEWVVIRKIGPIQPLSQRSNCCRSRKCIRWHIPMHAIFAVFFIYFSYLFYLGHLSLLGLQTKTRRQSNSSTFCSFKSYNPETFMSSAASASVHATRKRSQKAPRAKSGAFRFP